MILATGMACLVASCSDDEELGNRFVPTPGEDVTFSSTLDNGNTLTRTLYGPENTAGTGVMVKWVDGDLITVYGVDCAEGRKQAEYKVQAKTTPNTPNTADGQVYADTLIRTGEYGVQWGNASTSDFYAVYPAVEAGSFSANGSGVTVKTSIDPVQYCTFDVTDNVWQGIPFDNDKNAHGLANNIMVAYTPNAGAGENVNLRFTPFTTVLKFTVDTWKTAQDNPDLPTDPTGYSVSVYSITLKSPDGVAIAGDFNLNLSPTDTTATSTAGSNTIEIVPSAQIVWLYNQKLEFSIFTIPLSNQTLSGDWSVTISTSDGNKTFKLKPATNSNVSLKAGQIHKVKVPGFTVNKLWTYSNNNWLTTIPRNTYIADLSLPGSWYACDGGYQGGTLAEQYAAGIRAFNIDCRLTLKEGLDIKDYATDHKSNWYDKSNYIYDDVTTHASDTTKLILACSGTEKRNTGDYEINTMKRVKDALKEIGKLVAENTEEYAEIILTVAQKPKTESAALANMTFGTVNAQMMYTAIANVLNDAEVTPYLYTGQITPNTTLNDVLGKVVVKVNMNTENSNLKTWNLSMPAMVSEGTMAYEADPTRNIKLADFKNMNGPDMYWSNTFTPATGNAMNFYYHQAQNTSGSDVYPSVDNRKAAIDSIMSKSYSIYSKNAHNAWYQVGIGGWTSDDDTGKNDLSNQLNPFVLGIVNSMLTGTAYSGNNKIYKPAPVGAVLMNFATAGTTNSTQDLIDAIIALNGAYFLNRDEEQEPWPGVNSDTVNETEQPSALVYSGGSVFDTSGE